MKKGKLKRKNQSRLPWYSSGTCARCGEELSFVGSRVGIGGGLVHSFSKRAACADDAKCPPIEAYAG